MMRSNLRLGFPLGVLALLIGLVGAVSLLQSTPKVSAQASICHAAMVLDRSGSVGQGNETTLKNQLVRLFQPPQYNANNPSGGLYNPNIYLSFWSFSSGAQRANLFAGELPNPNPTNYDWPYHGYVTSMGEDKGPGSFDESLFNIYSDGGTNYEQGFGFNNGVPNPFISGIVNQTDIVVFMTDGLPNQPGNGVDNNSTARNAARASVAKLRQVRPGIVIIGGLVQNAVGNQSQSGLNYAINGSDADSTNTFQISSNYSDLARKLSSVIGTQCDLLNPPANYTLTPSVSTTGSVVSGSDSAQFNYSVVNASSTDSSAPVNWSVKRVLVNRGQSADPLSQGPFADGFEDQYSCAKLLTLINNQGNCQDVSSGTQSFSPRTTAMNGTVGAAAFVSSDDNWAAGTKVCYVLTVNKPTQNSSPTDRYSKAACIILAKRPTVQIWGGDLRVGRRFVNDNSGTDTSQASVIGEVTTKLDGRTYGSWAEYGVFAPGVVVGFASLSGMQGGALSNTQDFWNKLTFANVSDPNGEFAKDVGLGTIPDVKTALLSGRNIARNLTGVDSIDLNGNAVAGKYQKDLGNLTINSSTIQPGRTIIVYVPAGSVTIAGNINYSDGPYRNINDIPQLIIIAKNIVIAPGVSNVDSWLIADDPNSGTISTCSDSSTLTTQICNQQLKINGAVMAQHLDLRRTAGAGVATPAGCAQNSKSSCPAEIINLPADAYLWSQSEGRSDVRAQTTFTTELPPYF